LLRAAIWEQLALDVESDIQIRNKQLAQQNLRLGFKMARSGNMFSIFPDPQDEERRRAVKFYQQGSTISVKTASNEPILDATVSLNRNRECRFIINGEEMESWRLRMIALRSLFFEIA
jgi:hypothetical protein